MCQIKTFFEGQNDVMLFSVTIKIVYISITKLDLSPSLFAMKFQFILTQFLLQIVIALARKSRRCFSTSELDFFTLGAICHGTPSMPALPCEHALDYNPITIWHPPRQENQFFEVTLNRKVGLNYIEILQNKWPHGYARKIR